MLLRSGAPLAAHALELGGVLLLVHEAAGCAAALGPVLLALHLGLQLRALAHCALAGVVTHGFVDGHRAISAALFRNEQGAAKFPIQGRLLALATNARTCGMISGNRARTSARVMPGRTRG